MDPGADQDQTMRILGMQPERPPVPQSIWNSRAWELENLFRLPVPDASTIVDHPKE